jgi:hypothetical protein
MMPVGCRFGAALSSIGETRRFTLNAADPSGRGQKLSLSDVPEIWKGVMDVYAEARDSSTAGDARPSRENVAGLTLTLSGRDGYTAQKLREEAKTLFSAVLGAVKETVGIFIQKSKWLLTQTHQAPAVLAELLPASRIRFSKNTV